MQLQTGYLTGTVTTPEGQAMPGVTITCSGGGAPLVQTTDRNGNYLFQGVMPGTYTVTATMEAFNTVQVPGVHVHMGSTTRIDITIQLTQLTSA